MERSNAWEKYSKTDLEKVFTFAEDYVSSSACVRQSVSALSVL